MNPREARLRDRLAGDGVLYASPSQPILHPDGSAAPWMFYSWGVTLKGPGLVDAAQVLLERLRGFRATQLATHGMTGLPLLSACVALGAGQYSGLAIRKQRKRYLSGRKVEGAIDRSQAVVVIDDSISSGTALRDAIGALEAEGLEVEGAVALVGFPNRGGLEWANQHGYRTEVIFDVAADLGMRLHRPAAALPPLRAVTGQPVAAEGCHPAALARAAARHVLTHGSVPVAPARLDADYDGRGGVFVSFRRVSDDHRMARDGFWHWDPAASIPPADVVKATVATLRTASERLSLELLDDLKVAVTFMGPLEAISPAHLDFERYAIVVRDDAGLRAGGALPNTQVFSHETQQYRHALCRNAGIGALEPHTLYRQEVHKEVELGRTWPTYGVPDGPELAWTTDGAVGAALTGYARSLLAGSTPAPPPLAISCPIDGVSVTLYRRGTLASAVAWAPGSPAELVGRAVGRAGERLRPGTVAQGDPPVAVAVTLLFAPEDLGPSGQLAATKVRVGLDALAEVGTGEPVAALPAAAVYNGWSKGELVRRLASRANTATPRWRSYRTAGWVAEGGWAAEAARTHRLRFGFPDRRDGVNAPSPTETITWLAEYTIRNMSRSRVPAYLVNILTGEIERRGTGPRQLHALMSLNRAGVALKQPTWCAAARAGVRSYLEDHDPRPGGFATSTAGPLADAIALAAVSSEDHPLRDHCGVAAAAARLQASVQPDGRIAFRPVRLGDPQDFDYLPGAVLVALAASEAWFDTLDHDRLATALRWNRHRFRVLKSWGMVGWQQQGWAAVHRRRPSDEIAAFVFELADFAVDNQVITTGAFLEDLSPDEPSFNTGFINEGLAAAWATAVRTGDTTRAGRYRQAWLSANRFMNTLLVHPGDLFAASDPVRGSGGVRLTPTSVLVRADSVSHWLNSLVSGQEVARLAV